MILGDILREAREKRGLTTSQVASATHILVQVIEGLENEDFSRIPAPIYGRGFVKLYGELLELDYRPLQAAFTDLWNNPEKRGLTLPAGTATATVFAEGDAVPPPAPAAPADAPDASADSDRDTPPSAEPVPDRADPVPPPPPPPADVATPPPAAPSTVAGKPVEYDLFNPPPKVEPPPRTFSTPAAPLPSPPAAPAATSVQSTSVAAPSVSAAPAAAQPVRRISPGAFASWDRPDTAPTAGESAANRFRETLSNVSHGVLSKVPQLPRNFGRIAVLVTVAVLLVVLAVSATLYLYRVTKPVTDGAPDSFAPSAEVSRPTAPDKAQTATQKDGAKTPVAAKAAKTAPAKTVRLRSTGEKVPPLYID